MSNQFLEQNMHCQQTNSSDDQNKDIQQSIKCQVQQRKYTQSSPCQELFIDNKSFVLSISLVSLYLYASVEYIRESLQCKSGNDNSTVIGNLAKN